MLNRLLAIGAIFVAVSIAWFVLGGTILYRASESDDSLSGKIARHWGGKHNQRAPRVSFPELQRVEESNYSEEGPKKRVTTTRAPHFLPLDDSKVNVAFALDHRQAGLLWYATYKVDFEGVYRYRNDSPARQKVDVVFSFPDDKSIYDAFSLTLLDAAGKTAKTWLVAPRSEPSDSKVTGQVAAEPGESFTLRIAYKSQGTERWSYSLGGDVARARNFLVTMRTDFSDIDFPADTLSPTTKTRDGAGWKMEWRYDDLLAKVKVGMEMPNKLQPGRIAGRITFFAPVSLFFFIVMTMVAALVRKIDIHPMHYFFLSAAFFAFHLLLAYLVDHISLHLSLAIASLVSVGLVVSYLATAISPGFAWRWAGPIQIVYLVLFSYSFFLKGYTGLTLTVAAVISLFIQMRLTARVNWTQVFAHRPEARQRR